MKLCTKCKIEKLELLFSKSNATKDGLQHHCKACKLEYQQNNPNRNAVSAKYRNAHKGECIARSIVSQKKNRAYYTLKAREWQNNNIGKVKEIKRRSYLKHRERLIGISRQAMIKRITLRQQSCDFSKFVILEAKRLIKQRDILTGIKWDMDHILPVSKGGTSDYRNIQVVPALWNARKFNIHTNTYFPRGENDEHVSCTAQYR